jgi:hypothetical protein
VRREAGDRSLLAQREPGLIHNATIKPISRFRRSDDRKAKRRRIFCDVALSARSASKGKAETIGFSLFLLLALMPE